MVRSNFHEFIFIDILKHFLERHLDCRRKDDLIVTSRCTYVGEFLCLADIDIEVTVTCVLSYDHTHVDFLARIHEELASVEEFVHGVCDGLSCFE